MDGTRLDDNSRKSIVGYLLIDFRWVGVEDRSPFADAQMEEMKGWSLADRWNLLFKRVGPVLHNAVLEARIAGGGDECCEVAFVTSGSRSFVDRRDGGSRKPYSRSPDIIDQGINFSFGAYVGYKTTP